MTLQHATPAEAATSPIVETTQGRVRGTMEDGIAVFRGIPYAEPPVGRLRFRPPERRRRWDGVLDATRFGDCHPQDPDPVENALMVLDRRPPEGDDCLNLNVWTPRSRRGGACRSWSGSTAAASSSARGADAVYDGATFARDGIVAVTLNYRLHPAGYLFVGDRPGSGAFGLLDQIAVLEWVQENIAAFGGDPDAVTDRRRVGRRPQRRPAARRAGGARALPAGDRAERRGVVRRARGGRAGDRRRGAGAPRHPRLRRRRDRRHLERRAPVGVARGRAEDGRAPRRARPPAEPHERRDPRDEPVDLRRRRDAGPRAGRRRRRRRGRRRPPGRHDAGRDAAVRPGVRRHRARASPTSRSERTADPPPRSWRAYGATGRRAPTSTPARGS